MGKTVCFYRKTIHFHRSLCRLIKPGNQLNQSGFCCSGLTYDPHGFPGWDLKAHIGKHVFFCFLPVFKPDMIKDNASIRYFFPLRPPVFDLRLFIDNLKDTASGSQRTGKHHEYIGNHHKRVQYLKHIAQKTCEFSHFHISNTYLLSSKPEDRQDRGIHD